MSPLPPVNPVAAVLGAAAAFSTGAVYWAAIAPRLSRAARAPRPPMRWPAMALAIGFVTRVAIAYTLGLILGLAGVRGAVPGAAVGALAFVVFVLSMLLAQAAFGERPWRTVAVGAPEALVGYALMGAVVGAL
jgi:Protein of unknown function (DUF1761)